MTCPLCKHATSVEFHRDKRRSYQRCENCALVYVPHSEHVTPEAEKAIYDTHQNTVTDEGYLRFLSRTTEPLIARLDKPSDGLDFGCGPGPALNHLMERAGHNVALYDVFYYPNEAALKQQYDFVTCTEAIEHFCEPHKEWSLLVSLLKPGAYLAIMTKLVIDQERFKTWHYKNDVTHVSFFSRETFNFLAQQAGLAIEFIGSDVILFKRPELV